jgi:hypothetical protein
MIPKECIAKNSDVPNSAQAGFVPRPVTWLETSSLRD